MTENGTCITLDWGPSLGNLDVVSENYVCGSLSCNSCKSLQVCVVVDYNNLVSSLVVDAVRELTELTCCKRIGLVSLNGCVHHTVSVVVQSNIELVVLACRNCNVEVLRLRSELQAVAKRVVDNTLRRWCHIEITLTLDFKFACDRSTVNSRNLSVSQSSLAHDANLEDCCEVLQLNRLACCTLSVHSGNTIAESVVCGVHLVLSEQNLALASSRVGDCVVVSNNRYRESSRSLASLSCSQSIRCNAVYRNLITLAPKEWIVTIHLIAELSTSLLQRERDSSQSATLIYKGVGGVSGTRDSRQRHDCCENFY